MGWLPHLQLPHALMIWSITTKTLSAFTRAIGMLIMSRPYMRSTEDCRSLPNPQPGEHSLKSFEHACRLVILNRLTKTFASEYIN